MELKNTKEKIIECAIDLFAEKGFSNVGIRELAKEVGIKPASIYNHFQSKDEIMDSIMELFYNKYYRSTKEDVNLDDLRKLFKDKNFYEIMEISFKPFIQSEAERIKKINRIIMIEQFNHPKAIKFWEEDVLINAIWKFKLLLDVLAEEGKIPTKTNTQLAAELIIRISVTYMIQFTHGQNGEETNKSLSMNTVNKKIFELINKGLLV